MVEWSNHTITLFLLGTALLLGTARLFGELVQRYHQPAVLGEIFAGIVLGPTILGMLWPDAQLILFPAEGPLAIALQAMVTLAITLFLLVAGLEVDLSAVGQKGKSAIVVGLVGIVVPFSVGFAPAWFVPEWLGAEPDNSPLVFALFFATAMSITALPVIAKILMDLNLFRSDIGITILAAAIFNDLVGWLIFALVLALMGSGQGGQLPVWQTAVITIAFAVLMLTVGRWLINRTLPWIQAHTKWPGGILGFAVTCAFLCAAFTEAIGVHAIFGAFLFGVALGDSHHMRQRTRRTIDQFVSFIFAPLFFASIGLHINFAQNFDLLLIVIVLVIASVGKIVGCGLAARWMGFPPGEARAIGYGMNARGAMEIILGILARQAGIIGDRLFVALVVMALVTSMSSGWLIQRGFGRRRKAMQLTDLFTVKTFVPKLTGTDRESVVRELSTIAAEVAEIDPTMVFDNVWFREEMFTSALGGGIAVPHAQLAGLRRPAAAVGLCPDGIDFDAPDGQPVRLVILLLTPIESFGTHLDLMASIARLFRDPRVVRDVSTRVTTYTEFLALLNIESPRVNAPMPV